jgi:parvulin-like peptidyl-prolyl isomerase
MRYLTYTFVLVAVATVLAACGGGGSGSGNVPSDAVATVGDQTITQAQFDALIAQAKRSYKSQKRTFPKAGTTAYGTLKNQAVQYLVQRAEFAQEAQKMDVKVTASDVDKRLDQIKKQYFGNSEKKYKQQLAQQGLTDDQVRGDIRASLISEKLFNKVTEDVKVSDSDIKAYYDQHLSQYSVPQQREVAHILVKSKALADKLYDEVKSGANFSELAKKYSEDPGSKSQGGKLTISKGQTVAPFDQTAFLLSKGQVSKPVKTQFGYHIIKALGDVKPAKTTPLSQVKASIKQQLEQQKKNDAMTSWTTKLKKDYDKKISYQTGYAPPTTSAATATTSQ